MYEYKAKLVRVIDGDTIEVNIDLGFDITFKQKIRLARIDTAEIFRPSCDAEREHGLIATDFVKHFLSAENLIIKTKKDKKGKYGRLLAEVFVDNYNLNDALITEGFEKKDFYE